MAIKNTFTHIFPLPWLQVNEMPELKRWVSFASFMHPEGDFLEVPFWPTGFEVGGVFGVWLYYLQSESGILVPLSEDGDGRESVAEKRKSWFFNLHRDY